MVTLDLPLAFEAEACEAVPERAPLWFVPLPLLLLAAILLAPLIWVGTVVLVAADAHKELDHES